MMPRIKGYMVNMEEFRQNMGREGWKYNEFRYTFLKVCCPKIEKYLISLKIAIINGSKYGKIVGLTYAVAKNGRWVPIKREPTPLRGTIKRDIKYIVDQSRHR